MKQRQKKEKRKKKEENKVEYIIIFIFFLEGISVHWRRYQVRYWRFVNLVSFIPYSRDIANNIQITALKLFLGFRDYVSCNC